MRYFFLLLLLTACCRVPEVAVSEDPISSNVDYEWVQGAWWESFDDPQLTYLIEKALANNPTMQETIDRIALAKYRARGVQSALYPTLDFNADSQKFAQSKTGIFEPIQSGPFAGQQTIPRRYTQTEYNFEFQWEIDLWQKNWNAWKAALSYLEAAKAQEMIVRQILSLAVAEAYYQLQVDRMRADLARLNLNYRQALAQLTQVQAQKNIQTSLVLNQRTSDIAYAEELKYAFELDVETDKNLLRALIAEEPCYVIELAPVPLQAWQKVVGYLPEELPLDVLAHRPDIQAYLWRVKAACHEIKVAEALFYPNVNFYALLGQQTIHLNKLFQSGSFYGNWGPALHLPIFEGGALRANLGIRDVEYRIAADQYHQGLLDAVRQVLDAIAIKESVGKQLLAVREQYNEAEKIVRLTELRMRSNVDSRFNLLGVQLELLKMQDAEVLMQWKNIQAVLRLIRALGGGYANG